MALAEATSSSKSRAKKLVAAVVMLIVATGLLYWNYKRSQPAVVRPAVRKVFAYDLKTREFSVVETSGPTLSGGLVGAHVFSDGDCSNNDKRWVGYLERLTPDALKAVGDVANPDPAARRVGVRAIADGIQVSDPESPDRWVNVTSEQGIQIKAAARVSREGVPAIECSP